MPFRSTARVPTQKASRYLQAVCKHWEHNLAVSYTADAATITFPKNARGAEWPDDGIVTLAAEADALVCVITASAEGQREVLKDALARHVDRFAFREAPLTYDWVDG